MKKFCWVIVFLIAIGYIFSKNDKKQSQMPTLSATKQPIQKTQESEVKYIGPKEWTTYYRDSARLAGTLLN